MIFRTHKLGDLTKDHVGQRVILSGWVHRRRDHGGIIFIDLRDRFGITQLLFRSEHLHEQVNQIRSEWVIRIEGIVLVRDSKMCNPKLPTGEIEVEVDQILILSRAKTPPFPIAEKADVNEELRLKYRYLDMRKSEILPRLLLRHQLYHEIRSFFYENEFIEVTTPILAKSTPEGARDYLVPSRIYPGTFFALPQSPQIFKQLLMIGGLDRYYQIATCFRDEDLRADRQPEFTQLDLEISFSNQETLFSLIENLLKRLVKKIKNIDLEIPFPRIPHKVAIKKYGTDKPDMRFDMHLIDVTNIAQKSSSTLFLDAINNQGVVKGINLKKQDLSRKKIDDYSKWLHGFQIRELAWIKVQLEPTGPLVKFFTPSLLQELFQAMHAETGDLLLFIADQPSTVAQGLDHLRRQLAKDFSLFDPKIFTFCWITQFPLLEKDPNKNYICTHHPFTAPHRDDLSLLQTNPLAVRAEAYDLVLNGFELASGSERIFDTHLQKKIFSLLNFSEKEIKNRFGFFIEALQYGTPPHLGIALGLDRIAMLFSHAPGIRDVIAFPKTQKAVDLMSRAPSEVLEEQLTELKIHIEEP